MENKPNYLIHAIVICTNNRFSKPVKEDIRIPVYLEFPIDSMENLENAEKNLYENIDFVEAVRVKMSKLRGYESHYYNIKRITIMAFSKFE